LDANDYTIRRHQLDSLNLTGDVPQDDGVTPINLNGYTVNMNVYDRRGGTARRDSQYGVWRDGRLEHWSRFRVDRTPSQITAWKLSNGKGACGVVPPEPERQAPTRC
jgi:hypothetical protein